MVINYDLVINWCKLLKEDFFCEKNKNETIRIGVTLFYTRTQSMDSNYFFLIDKEDADTVAEIFKKKLLPEKIKDAVETQEEINRLQDKHDNLIAEIDAMKSEEL